MLTFEEARERILALGRAVAVHAAPSKPLDRVPLAEAAGRVLAEDLLAPSDLPPFDYSAMDGYAVRAEDLAATLSLPVAGESRTGSLCPPLLPRTACRIFTGAPIPEGADTVVMQEQVTRSQDAATFSSVPRRGQHIRRRGEDLSSGSVALGIGARLGPGHLALAAMLDRATLRVSPRPRVTFLATGDELRAPGSAPLPGTIPESNTVALAALARRAGATVRLEASVRDELDATRAAVAAALEGADVLVTVGGVSVGDRDLVRPALEGLGVTLDFWRVSIKPGKPLAVGRRGETLVLGLPGNPASALVTFTLFGLPLLRAMQGDAKAVPSFHRARLARSVSHATGRLEFMRARLTRRDEGMEVAPFSNQSSGALTSMAEAEVLLCVPAERDHLEAGAWVDVLPLGDGGP